LISLLANLDFTSFGSVPESVPFGIVIAVIFMSYMPFPVPNHQHQSIEGSK